MNAQKKQQKQRLKQAFEYLKEQGRVKYYTDVAQAMRRNVSSVRGALSASSPYITDDFIQAFVQAFPGIFSEQWLLEGKGQMLLDTAPLQVTTQQLQPWERVLLVVKNEGVGIDDFAHNIGVHPSTLSRMFQAGTRPIQRTIKRITAHYPHVSEAWLSTGEGAMYTHTLPQGSNAQPYAIEHHIEATIIPDTAAAGSLSSYSEAVLKGLPTTWVPASREHKGEYYMFKVEGVSMDDGTINAIADGDLVVARRIPPEYWQSKLHYRDWRYFVILTKEDGVIVKEIVGQNLEAGTIECHSLNPEYTNFHLHLSKVQGIFNVVNLIRNNLRQ